MSTMIRNQPVELVGYGTDQDGVTTYRFGNGTSLVFFPNGEFQLRALDGQGLDLRCRLEQMLEFRLFPGPRTMTSLR